MYYQPPRTLGLLVGGALTLWPAAVALLLLDHGLTAGVTVPAVAAYSAAALAAVLAALFARWTYALATLSYAMDRNGLVITWGAIRQVIPLSAIERLVPGTSVEVPRTGGVSWPGHHVGRAHVEQVGEVLFYSSHQTPEQVLYVVTSELSYAISVEDPTAFAREVQVRQELGPTATVSHHVERAGVAAQRFWVDRPSQALALLAIAAAATLWALVAARYGGLPAVLELQFPPGQPAPIVSVTSRDAILALPRTASAMLAVNLLAGLLLHGWNRAAAALVFVAAAALQVAFLAAVWIALP